MVFERYSREVIEKEERERIARALEVHTWLWHIADWLREGAEDPPPTSASPRLERP